MDDAGILASDTGNNSTGVDTMKIKTNELQGAALDWSVAKCEGRENDGEWDENFSTNWLLAGPIVEREGISLNHLTITEDHNRWAAHAKPTLKDVKPKASYGPTTLIAAMRCYVASKLGDEIEIPEETEE